MNQFLPFAFPAKTAPHLPTMKEWEGTTMVSKQSAQERYVADIAVVINCSNRHASLGKWV